MTTRLDSFDASMIVDSVSLVKPELIQRLCSDYAWSLRELGQTRRKNQDLNRRMAAYKTWLQAFVEVCPPPEDENSDRELVERLLKGVRA